MWLKVLDEVLVGFWTLRAAALPHYFISTSSSRNKGIYWVYFQLQTEFLPATCTDTSCWNKATLQRLKLPEGLHSNSGEKLDVPDTGSCHPKLSYGVFLVAPSLFLIKLQYFDPSSAFLIGAQMVSAALLLLSLARWTHLDFRMPVKFHDLLSLQSKMKV